MSEDVKSSYCDIHVGGEDIPAGGKPLASRNIEMDARIEGFERRLNRDNGNKTKSTKNYSATARRFLSHGNIEGKSSKEWTKDDVDKVYDDWASEPIRPRNPRMKGFRDPNTMIQSIWAMNRFFDYIGRPDLKQKTKKPIRREVVPLTDAEMMSLMETIRTMSKSTTSDARNYAKAVGLMDTAARNGEMTNLKRSDVDFDRKVVILKDTKSGDDQYLPLTPEFEAAILEYLKFRPKGKTPEDDEYLFLTKSHKKMDTGDTWEMVRMAGFKAGIQRPIWPHLLRHSRLDQLARTMTIPDLQKVSRHARIETLMRYVHAGSREVARQVQELSLFNKVRVKNPPKDGMREKTVTRSKPQQEDAKVQFALLNAQLLKEGKIDLETYKSVLALTTG